MLSTVMKQRLDSFLPLCLSLLVVKPDQLLQLKICMPITLQEVLWQGQCHNMLPYCVM